MDDCPDAHWQKLPNESGSGAAAAAHRELVRRGAWRTSFCLRWNSLLTSFLGNLLLLLPPPPPPPRLLWRWRGCHRCVVVEVEVEVEEVVDNEGAVVLVVLFAAAAAAAAARLL
jgi:hypothetical protein